MFPGLCCDMLFVVADIGSDGLLGTEALQSYHTSCICVPVSCGRMDGLCNSCVTFHGNTVPAGNTLSLMSALYLWATLVCGVFGCHGNLV